MNKQQLFAPQPRTADLVAAIGLDPGERYPVRVQLVIGEVIVADTWLETGSDAVESIIKTMAASQLTGSTLAGVTAALKRDL